jgi:hypothetical protein
VVCPRSRKRRDGFIYLDEVEGTILAVIAGMTQRGAT